MTRVFVLERGRARAAPDGARAERLALLTVCAGMFMMLLDTMVVNVAQGPIRSGLDTGLTEMQWVIDAYLLVFSVPLLAFGRLGDVYGRRRLFVLGTILFTAASCLCSAASLLGTLPGLTGAQALIGARALQGVGAAMVLPQTFALIAAFTPPARRGAAYGLASAFASLAAVVGPLGGGLIATHLAWEGIFLMNLPVGVAIVVAAGRFVPESRDPAASRRLDWGGMLLSGLGLFALVFGLIEASRLGWTDPLIIATLCGGVLLLTVFVRWERRAPAPMLRLELFRIRNFSAGALAMACFTVGVHGTMLPLSVFLQGALGYSATKAGLVLAPSAVAMALVAPFGGRLSDRIGSRGLLAGGFALTALAEFGIAAIVGPGVTQVALVVAMAALGVGIGLIISQINVAPLREVPVEIAGAASGIVNAVRTTATVLGVAALASLLQAAVTGRAEEALAGAPLSDSIRRQVVGLVAEGRFDRLGGLGSPADAAALAALHGDLRAALGDGLATTLLAAATVLIAGVGASLLLRTRTVAAQPTLPPVVEPLPSGD